MPLKTLSNSIFTLETQSLKRWTIEDYHRMSELGILDAEERTELIEGQITLMAAKGTHHVTSLYLLANLLREQVGNRALIRTQDPIQLNDFSEPEPDLAIVLGKVWDYVDHHPCPEDISLIIEIADSTLKYDCEIKDKLYAQAGIVEYWVLDLKNRQLHLFCDPTPTAYKSHLILTEPNQVSPLAFSDVIVSLSAILPSVA
ncbi:protein of unknown function DUF820 [Rippkaea orientalis PCC 8801]|uniref:Putative restriction endonuclease domain-containing protein n=1 Tax=Rippkaea orientalis (strain PCC 8801 / RF-1) TaxID=41431 RepID=B7JUB0_RIPO1|nr:Uma2 family endonuclease [Rippkaea orientalis]ACK64490.1 protein of unknown function DUF820 [Rippkaea orientalis PCC 8801]